MRHNFYPVASFDLTSFCSDVCDIRYNFYLVAIFDLTSFDSYDCVSNMISILLRYLISHRSAVMFAYHVT